MRKEFDRVKRELQEIEDEDIVENIKFEEDSIKIYNDVEMDERLDKPFAIFDAVPTEVITNVKLPDDFKGEEKNPPIRWGKMYSTKENHVDVRYEDILWVSHEDYVELKKVGSDYDN